LAGPVVKGSAEGYRAPPLHVPNRSGGSVDTDGDLHRAGPGRTRADREEIRAVHVDDPVVHVPWAVVRDHPVDAPARGSADPDDRAARDAHGRRAVVVERGDPGQLVA